MSKKEMVRHHPCEAVMLLMQRMESDPDEFALNSSSKWHHVLDILKRRVVDKEADAFIILEDFECEMLWNKFKHAGKKTFHKFVMQKILEGDEK
jgi:hypothetical protein